MGRRIGTGSTFLASQIRSVCVCRGWAARVVAFSNHSLGPLAGGDEAGLVGDHDQLRSVADVQFRHRPVDVRLGGGRADHQPVGDFVVGQAKSDQGEDFPLACGQFGQSRRL
jgi:hypothetical protein